MVNLPERLPWQLPGGVYRATGGPETGCQVNSFEEQ
jgi:hypothetical protein